MTQTTRRQGSALMLILLTRAQVNRTQPDILIEKMISPSLPASTKPTRISGPIPLGKFQQPSSTLSNAAAFILELLNTAFESHTQIFTDASKQPDGTTAGAAVFFNNEKISCLSLDVSPRRSPSSQQRQWPYCVP
jgi:hypothetical protein